MSATNAFGLNHVKTYNNIVHDPFLRVMIHSFLRVIIHASSKQNVDGKYIILTSEPMREQNAFHVTFIPSILRWTIFMRNFMTQLCITIQCKQL